ncbi:MAG: hypothetical protein ACFCVG_10385 [Kineosporiaceae bacterium]
MSAGLRFARFFDDAALFPPARLPIKEAIPGHLAHRASDHAGVVGPFIAAPAHLAAVDDAAAGHGVAHLDVAISGRRPDVAAAMATLPSHVRAVSLEVAGPAADVLAFLAGIRDSVGGAPTPQGYAEVGLQRRPQDVLADLDAVAAAAGEPRPRAKFRTGGTTAEAFPTDAQLAVGVVGTVRLGLPFKLTAGLHDPARHRDPATGFEHHGLLNVLLATDAALRGAEVEAVSAVLADRDEAGLAAAVRELPEDRVREVRRHALSVGTCSIDECVAGLARVGVLDLPVGAVS